MVRSLRSQPSKGSSLRSGDARLPSKGSSLHNSGDARLPSKGSSLHNSGDARLPSKGSSLQSGAQQSGSLRSAVSQNTSKTSSKSSKKTASSKESGTSKETAKTDDEVEEVERPQWEIDEERRRNELVEFLEDLGNSEEFEEFLREKQRKREEREKVDDVPVVEEIEEIDEGDEEKFPLTQKSVFEREMKRRYENLLMNRINKRKLRIQDESIARIRQIIAFDKSRFYCHTKERAIERQKLLDEALEELEERLQINVANVHLIKDKITASFLCYNKIRKFQKKQRRERKIAIIRKLLKEYERQKQIDEEQNKTYDYKVKKKEKIISDMEVVGFAIPFPEEPHEEILEPEEEKEFSEVTTTADTSTTVDKPVKKGKKGKKEKKEPKPKKEKKEKKEKKPKEKKVKEKKPKSEDAQKFTLPQIPQVNERNKVVPYETHKMLDLIKDLPELDKVEQEKIAYAKELRKSNMPDAEKDTLTVVTPKELVFKGFKNGTVYKKRLTLLNSSSYTRKYRLYTIDLQMLIDPQLIQIDHFGIQKLAPGISFTANVAFSPLKLNEYFRATIVFLSHYADTGEKFYFSVPVTCIPLYSEIIITPEEVCFETTPIWVAQKRNKLEKSKFFIIKNCGTRASFITIRKIRNPLQIEEEDENENIAECIENVFNYFEFENYILEMKPESKRILRVFFKNADHVGFYYERYSVDVYEKIDGKTDKFLGCQEISLTAETTGAYISATPENLDFSYCVLNSVYQLPVCIKNNDKLPHCLSLKFPKRLSTNVRASATNIIIQSKQRTLIYLTLIPRIDTMNEDNPYYDEDTSLLKFPVYIYVSEKSAADVPPIKIMLFAAICPPLSLTLKPIRRSRTSFNESALFSFAMGDCTTRETVYGKISITNESDVVQHFGFLNLPESVIIMPNYGFGVVDPWQTVILTIIFSPKFEDIPETELIAMKMCYNVTFNLVVDTVKNLGGIKEFMNYKGLVQLLKKMEREIEYPNEPPILHEIYRFHYQLIKNQYEQFNALQEPEESEASQQEDNRNVEDVPAPMLKEIKSGETTIPSNEAKSIETSRHTIRSSRKSITSTHSTQISLSLPEPKDLYRYFGLPSPTPRDEHSTEIAATEDDDDDDGEETRRDDEQHQPIAQSVKSFLRLFEYNQNKLQIEATIVNPLCELSHQFLAFPTTPCGSYSMMTIELRALWNPFDLQCDCGYLKKKYPELFAPIDYEAEFEIVGTGSQFTIEPTCGLIKSGERLKLTVIARPQTPADIVEDQAKAIKIEEIRRKLIEGQMEEKAAKKKKKKEEKKEKKVKEKKKKDGKKGKKGKVVEKEVEKEEEEDTEVEVPENMVVLSYLDYFPAEMCVWRSLEPYSIESDFICTVRYHNRDIDRRTEKLLMKATCKVIRPDFITNLRTQHLDFGSVAINSTAKEYIAIQNIKSKYFSPLEGATESLYQWLPLQLFYPFPAEAIRPTLTILLPTGPFYCPDLKYFTLGPEATFNLPINFTPLHENEVVEYAEIRSGKTVYPLKITGRGVRVHLGINPEFVVYRMEAQRGGRTMLTLELFNESEAKVPIKLVKTHELEGQMVKLEKPKAEKKGKLGKKSKESKGSASSKSSTTSPKKEKKGKKPKHSMELTEDEEYSIKTLFKPRNEESFFYVDDPAVIEPKNKIIVKLRFGVPMTPEELEEEKKGKKKGKKQAKPITNDDEEIKPDEPKKYYVAKYNILLGSQIWRDLIIIASFK